MEKELKIEIPEGYEIDRENSTFERIVFKKKETKLPESWEEFCSITKGSGYYIDNFSGISQSEVHGCLMSHTTDRNLLSTREDCEAHRALMQLHRLRDCYRQGWVPNRDVVGYTIIVGDNDGIHVLLVRGFLSFQNREIAIKFAGHFRDLIIQAKELLR